MTALRPWTGAEVKRMRELWEQKLTTVEIARLMHRSRSAVRNKAIENKFPPRRERLGTKGDRERRQVNLLVTEYMLVELKKEASRRGCPVAAVAREFIRKGIEECNNTRRSRDIKRGIREKLEASMLV